MGRFNIASDMLHYTNGILGIDYSRNPSSMFAMKKGISAALTINKLVYYLFDLPLNDLAISIEIQDWNESVIFKNMEFLPAHISSTKQSIFILYLLFALCCVSFYNNRIYLS